MALTLAQVGDGVHCQQASNATDALALLESDPNCDLLVVDLMLPEINGFSLLGVIAKRFPDVPALVVSALDDRESVQRAMKAGQLRPDRAPVGGCAGALRRQRAHRAADARRQSLAESLQRGGRHRL